MEDHPQHCPTRNYFCFICGLFTPKNHSRPLTRTVIEAFEKYYIRQFEPSRWYMPEIICDYCRRAIISTQTSDTRHPMKFVAPITWLSVFIHDSDDCYCCQTYQHTIGVGYDRREKIKYAEVDSVIPARVRSARHPKSASELEKELNAGAGNDFNFDAGDDFNVPLPTDMAESEEPSTSTGQTTTAGGVSSSS